VANSLLDRTQCCLFLNDLALQLATFGLGKLIVLSSLPVQGAPSLCHSCLYIEFKVSNCSVFPPQQPLQDQFLAMLVQFIHLHQLPTVLLIAQAQKFSVVSYLDTKQVVVQLAKGMRQVMPSFTAEKIDVRLLKPNKHAFVREADKTTKPDEQGKQEGSVMWYI